MVNADWQRFERLVARIERFLAPIGAVVTSPDHLTDKVTGQPREVDATIRMRVGSSTVLITIECRKRNSVQDVTWIEQLATKRGQVGADKTIAVASEGFSAPATKAAEFHGIDVRRLEDVTSDDDVRQWFGTFSWIAKVGGFELKRLWYFDLAGQPLGPSEISAGFLKNACSKVDAPLLVRFDGTAIVSGRDVAVNVDFSQIALDEPPLTRRVQWVPPPGTDAFVPSEIGRVAVGAVEVEAAYTHRRMPIELAAIADYSTAQDTLVRVVKGSVTPEEGHTLSAEILLQPQTVSRPADR